MRETRLFTLFCIICLFFFGCGEKEKNGANESGVGAIHGKVNDYDTGAPVSMANVSLYPGNETALTGDDGEYEFLNIEDGNYYISVSKAEYSDLRGDNAVIVRNGQRIRRDIQIKKLPTYLRITDMEGNDINSLDFGSGPTSVVRSFNIFNNGTVHINCSLVYSCVWISSVTSITNTISPGQTVTVSVSIDRAKLVAGVNTTYLYIKSNNGNNVLKISASGQENLPVVVTLPVTNPDGTQGPYRNTFHGNVTNVGYPPYSKRGFCWSSSDRVPTINNDNIEIAGNGPGEYSYSWYGWWDNPPSTAVTYYVRAWIRWGPDNTIIYGNVMPFVFNDF
ncbi:MAG: carboxypeptidase regulatory-like domain-containing protein [Bacteroidales bacterium]|nr:carboxypeptidase regulatory-like domain-containing protein [Bacteroidales bacterium]